MSEVAIDKTQIVELSKCIEVIKFKEEYMNRSFLRFESSYEYKANAYMFASAVCHQTHNLKNVSSNLIGWNYIEYVFQKLAEEEHHFLDFEYIQRSEIEEIGTCLASFFPRSTERAESSLENVFERASLIKEIVLQLANSGYKNAYDYLLEMKTSSVDFIYDNLSKIRAFSDPYRKKSTLLLKLLHQSDVIAFSEIDKVNPLMDYHMQRLLLRTGCVMVQNEDLSTKLKKREPIDSDRQIREACIEAIKCISKESSVSILDLDDLFWAIGRSCCNNKIMCKSGECDKSPCTLTTIIADKKHEYCILQNGCRGYNENEFTKFWEPNVITEYY